MAIEEIEARKGIGIWGNSKCLRCGACCYEMNRYLYEKGARKTELCGNFGIKEGKAYCSMHEKHRAGRNSVCPDYFCGNTDFVFRFNCKGDETLRKLAEELGTAPADYAIPKPPAKKTLKFPFFEFIKNLSVFP